MEMDDEAGLRRRDYERGADSIQLLPVFVLNHFPISAHEESEKERDKNIRISSSSRSLN